MKKIKSIVALSLSFALAILVFPLSALAGDEIETIEIPDGVTDIIPPASDISPDQDYAEGQSIDIGNIMPQASTSVSGGCSITKNSSTQVSISGYSVCSESDPALKVTLTLQAYYDGDWHDVKTKVNSTSGTRVELYVTYNVTTGYYYRVLARHSLASGITNYTQTKSIWVG